MGLRIIWLFDVKPDRVAEFERVYGADGEWAALFRRVDGFEDVELLRDVEAAHRYVVIDRWASAAAFEEFRARWKAEYEALDARCEELTVKETFVARCTD
jgi:heme-degrading monooxygenase HmoA